jgi:hypothetical protein
VAPSIKLRPAPPTLGLLAGERLDVLDRQKAVPWGLVQVLTHPVSVSMTVILVCTSVRLP